MSEQTSYFRLGAFVLSGTALLVIALLVFGAGALRQKGVLIETYLDESVQGLEVGAPVKLRGVPVGTVTEISFVRDVYGMGPEDPRFAKEGRYVLVRARLSTRSEVNYSENAPGYTRMLEEGLRVRLATQGITGTSYLEIDFVDPRKNPPLQISWTPEYIYVPSAPSTITRLSDAAEQVFDRLSHVDIEGVVKNVNDFLFTLEDTTRKAELEKLSAELRSLVAEARATNATLDRTLKQTDVVALQKEIGDVLRRLSSLVDETSASFEARNGQAAEVLDRLRASLDNLEAVSNDARSYPSVLLLGDPPPAFDPGAPR